MAETFVSSSSTPAATQVNVMLQELRSKAKNPTTSVDDLRKALNDGLEWLLTFTRDKDNAVWSNITQKYQSEVFELRKERVSNIEKEEDQFEVFKLREGRMSNIEKELGKQNNIEKEEDQSKDFKLWKERVSNIEKEVTSLNKRYEGPLRHTRQFLKRGHIETEIKKALSNVIKLVEECPPERVIKEIGVPSIARFSTLHNALQEIQDALLQKDGPKCVSFEGEDCVRKTIIMQQLNNFFYDNPDNNKFDVVIFIKVVDDEQTDEALHILQKIAKRMKVHIEGYEDRFEVAGRVRKVLKNMRYLLMLDGLRQSLTLSRIWYSLENSGSMWIACKVVITTQYDSYSMPTFVERRVRLKTLSPSEEWKEIQERTSSSKSTDAIGEPDLGQDLSRLMKTWDFLQLILSYPMRIGYEDFLKQWIYDASQIGLRGLKHILYDKSPLRYLQAVIPQDIATEIINGGRVSSDKPLKQVPQPIILLATHLALHQLTLTFTSNTIPYSRRACDAKIENIRFSTRNDAEKRTVVENIRANSQICATFDDVEIIDLNQINDQTQREQALLNLDTTLKRSTSCGRQLALVVDGDGDKKLDPKKVSLPIVRYSENVVVFITELSSARQNDYFSTNVDLTINTNDHSLPWELFCKIVGSELLHSSIAIQEIAVQIVEKCGGHLLAIILMAESLKHVTDVQTWDLALKKLLYRAREAIVNAFLFNIIWANVNSEAKKYRRLRCLMIFKFLDWKMTSDDELFHLWISKQLVHTEEEAKSTLQNFMECSLLLQFEDTLGSHNIQLPEDIKIILHAMGEEMPENLSEGASESTISDLQVLNLSYAHMRNLYAVNTQDDVKELNLKGSMVETLPEAIFKLHKIEIWSLEDCSQLLELPQNIAELENLKELRLSGCERLETLPEAIFKLRKLETVSLEHCSRLLELPPQIAKLENLKELRLSGCKRLETLPKKIWELPNLEVCDLSGTHITDLPRSLNFPNLRSLLLGTNLNLMKISPSFFDGVPLLTVLDLSRTSIHELPSSIINLQQLRELYLKDCELFAELLPEIRRLSNLVTLDLDGTLITHLPKEIEELTNLESLSLSFHNDDSSCAVIPLGVLSRLTKLKVLKTDVNSDNEWWSKHVDDILKEIKGLKMLQALDMYIPRDSFVGNGRYRCRTIILL